MLRYDTWYDKGDEPCTVMRRVAQPFLKGVSGMDDPGERDSGLEDDSILRWLKRYVTIKLVGD